MTAFAVDEGARAARVAQTWTRWSAGLLRGLTHALGNRLHSLGMLQSGSEAGEPLTEELLGFLSEEIAGCDAVAEGYRTLVFGQEEETVACRLPDLVPTAVALRAAHVDVRDPSCPVEIVGDPPAVLIPPRAGTQAILLLLLAAEQGNDVEFAAGVAVTGDGDEVQVTVAARRDAPAGLVDGALEAATWLLRESRPPARVARQTDATGVRLVLSLPSLAASRRAEREAAR